MKVICNYKNNLIKIMIKYNNKQIQINNPYFKKQIVKIFWIQILK